MVLETHCAGAATLVPQFSQNLDPETGADQDRLSAKRTVSGVLFDASMRESAEFGEIRDALVREVSALGSRALVMQYKISLLIGDNRSRCDGTIQQATMPEHTIINKTCTKDESAATQFGHLVLMKLS
eukprot:2986475-Rhodomonas_salina.1